MATTIKQLRKPGDETPTEEKKTVYCQITPEVHAAVLTAAEREFRSIAAQAEMILTQWAQKNAGGKAAR